MELYKRIKARREELGMSQEELATQLGYKSRSTINKIEMGKNDITQSKIKAFAKALDTTPAYLMGWDDNTNTEPKQSPKNTSICETDPDMPVLHMYKKLDDIDKAEIRGEMKQMLKADKYSNNKIVDVGRAAAYGGKKVKIEITEERAKIIHELRDKLKDDEQ